MAMHGFIIGLLIALLIYNYTRGGERSGFILFRKIRNPMVIRVFYCSGLLVFSFLNTIVLIVAYLLFKDLFMQDWDAVCSWKADLWVTFIAFMALIIVLSKAVIRFSRICISPNLAYEKFK